MPIPQRYLIAVDPSLTSTGVAVFGEGKILETFVIKTKPTQTNRLQRIANEFKDILKKYPCNLMAIETQYLSIRSSSVIRVIEVKGLLEGVFTAVSEIPVTIIEVTPSEAKKAVNVKNGRGVKRAESKELVKRAVREKYPELDFHVSVDVTDAIAIGTAGFGKYRDILTEQLANKNSPI